MKKINSGITLTELLIVVAIIAFLAIVAFWAYRTQIFKGFDSRRKTDIYQIKVAVEEYEKDHDCYPLPQAVICDPGTGLQPYIPKVPCDPRTGASYYYDHEDSSCPKWFRIYTTLENLTDSDYMGSIGPNGGYNYYSGSPNAPAPPTLPPRDQEPDPFTAAEVGFVPRFCGIRTVPVLSVTPTIKALPVMGSVPSRRMSVNPGNEIFF